MNIITTLLYYNDKNDTFRDNIRAYKFIDIESL